ncbi:hypothetical protein PHYPSEUDO_015005 [Phytophthora pseudosyringae]|uniref:Uncharacterized protein n=1 Tax=Phytophthora pseudosyringae TaxID=221518 RepID=A0A8T1WFP4_9STRA|nr:hypothetical protein PHYPSEUDO_015005 [Phytophthora pseudosyringae]
MALVDSFRSTELDEEGQKRLLDKYNSISGSLTVLSMKPVDMLLSMLVAVADMLCNRGACLMPELYEYTEAGTVTTVYPRVQAVAICLNDAGKEELTVDFEYFHPDEGLQSCRQRSNTSMIIVSVGKRIEGDAFEADPAGTQCSLNVLAYCGQLTQLPETFCWLATLAFLLSPINMNFNWFSVGSSQWKILASTVEETRGAALKTETRPALTILPRYFESANTSLTEHMINNGSQHCEKFIDKQINHIEKNHLYIEHTLQPANTAGLYFIFQNAVVLSQLPPNASVHNGKSSLAFKGNSQEMHIRASIPTKNAFLTLAGWSFRRYIGKTWRGIAAQAQLSEYYS